MESYARGTRASPDCASPGCNAPNALTRQVANIHASEVDRVTFTLQCNPPARQRRAVDFHRRIMPVHRTPSNPGPRIREYGIPVDDVRDQRVTVDDHFRAHPLI